MMKELINAQSQLIDISIEMQEMKNEFYNLNQALKNPNRIVSEAEINNDLRINIQHQLRLQREYDIKCDELKMLNRKLL